MAPPRIPPTRFGPAAAQPGGRPAGPARRLPPAPPPTRYGPNAALLRKLAPSPLARGAGVIQRMETGVASTGNKAEIAKKPCASCTMGQGVAGPLDEVMLHSTGFSSCSPIVMFNSATCWGGLFHFAAGNLDKQKGALLLMLKDVQPTELYIPKRDELTQGTWDGIIPRDAHREESGQPEDDSEILKSFFQQHFKKTIKMTPSGETFYVTANASRQLVISPGLAPGPMVDMVDYSKTNTPTIPPDCIYAMSSVVCYGRNMYKS